MPEPRARPKTVEARPPNWRIRAAALGTVIALVGAVAYLALRARAPKALLLPAASAQPAGSIVRRWNMVPPPEPAQGLVGRREGHRHKRGYQKMLDSYLEATRYPPTSRPLSEMQTHRLPEAPPTASRSQELAGGKEVEQREHQDKYYVAEGESATVTVAIAVDGKPVPDASGSGSLAKLEGTPRAPGASVASVNFHDDGAAPDEHGKDGTVTALVGFPKENLAGFVGDLTLVAALHAGDASFMTSFGFLYTGHPPAHFTGEVREAVEDGSLALHLGIEVETDAEYVLRARLYDADGNAIVIMSADGRLYEGRRDVKFVAFGRLLRDLAAKSPYSLRDAEAYVMEIDKYPDRLKVPTWVGPYVTRRYSPGDFSDKDWTSPEKQKRVEEMQQLIESAPE